MKTTKCMKMKDETYIVYLKSKGLANRSIESMCIGFGQYAKWAAMENMELEEMGYNDLLLFQKHCKGKGILQGTVQKYMVAVKHYYAHLLEAGKITTDPTQDVKVLGVKRKTLYHTFDANGLNRLYNRYNDESLKGKRNKIMLGLMVYQGLKTEELAQLETDNIKLREGKVEVMAGRKSNSRILQLEAHQVMDMYDYVLQIRREILKESKQETDKLLVSPSGGNQISNFMTGLMIKLRKIDPKVKNAKQLRASIIVKWLGQYNLREVQYMAGHRYISSTESYQQSEMEGLKEEVQQFQPFG